MVVLVADDKKRYRDEVTEVLTECFANLLPVIQATNGDEACRLFKTSEPEPSLVCLDLRMPGKSGVAVALEIWDWNKHLPIVFYTNHDDEFYVNRIARKAPGTAVFGYLLKDENSKEDLAAKIRRVLDGDCCVDDAAVAFSRANKVDGFTDSEFEALVYVALGLKDEAIAEAIGLTLAGIQWRLRSVYKKLEVDLKENSEQYNRRALSVAKAIERGLITDAQLKQWRKELDQGKRLSDI